MSDPFDPSAIADGVFRRHDIGVAATLNRRLIDCDYHDGIYALFDKLEGVPAQPHKKPADTIDGPVTVYVYGKDGQANLELKQTLASASVKYHFPDGLTITKLRRAPLTYRLDDPSGRQLVVQRKRDAKTRQRFWEVMNKSGFDRHRGHRAGRRFKGKSADRSFD